MADKIELLCGDCLEVMKGLADNSVHSVVTDPPYHLTSIVKRFGADNAAPAKVGKTGAFARSSAGFMGKQWDGGDIAFRVELWAEVLRILKPGGHVAAFSGTRTYHRMACAIEDAGFEIRDQLAWCYGSGFPKSYDVSKGIDRRKDWDALPRLQVAIKVARVAIGLTQSEAARRMGLIGPDETLGGGGFMWFETGKRMPTREQWPTLKAALSLSDEFDAVFEEAEREITGTVDEWSDRSNYALTSKDGFRRDKPASDAAREWDGWGTALKPAWEPIALARKPLIGTVAANVLAHGTGAINIDGCRVGTVDDLGRLTSNMGLYEGGLKPIVTETHPSGRWPANIIHDGSDEVVGAFPESGPAKSGERNPNGKKNTNAFGDYYSQPGVIGGYNDDGGSAARFFYTAKADSDDRLGSKHPTVKPVDLMQWLVRLITPKGGLVLDPFAGTGTTGEAAFREGMRATLIEREAEYQADIRRRMALFMAGPEERRRESIKERTKDKPADHGPLFGGTNP